MNPTALICGISGQDGDYLAQRLHSKGYCVIGTARGLQTRRIGNLDSQGVRGRVQVVSMAIYDLHSVSPDESDAPA